MTRMETHPSGKSAVQDKSNFFKCVVLIACFLRALMDLFSAQSHQRSSNFDAVIYRNQLIDVFGLLLDLISLSQPRQDLENLPQPRWCVADMTCVWLDCFFTT